MRKRGPRQKLEQCRGCDKLRRREGQTCGARVCIAHYLYYAGLTTEPTVEALDAWYSQSLIRQITEYESCGRNSQRVVMYGLVRQYALLQMQK